MEQQMWTYSTSLTKREYIAAQVLPQLAVQYWGTTTAPHGIRDAAVAAVRYADALIKALNEIEIGG